MNPGIRSYMPREWVTISMVMILLAVTCMVLSFFIALGANDHEMTFFSLEQETEEVDEADIRTVTAQNPMSDGEGSLYAENHCTQPRDSTLQANW